ncbi:hypothetical protein P152DRAFT_507906 [Eremomyces bilateralis CBS 781.70]|uniref:N-acetylgalactosaminide beta-1,3-galactosyltransferase n=1 Tax=Eremomyces bilateralis CBS 781.70 TaxID=1392243 RepID=A0A6G1G0S7_9PEZI|nr:uncharacterized protein P152DRAFT_507906 [Eremomyces bilateralis CBS 781.70]KAF1811715.1 hypothetical protein P152DRAFT_507906 [Eremomyces bilateralis CBS 781.70]
MDDEYIESPVLHDPRCAAFPDLGNVVIAVKTGATEVQRRLPIQMLTSLRCVRNVMVFSDLEEDVAGFHIHDALDMIPSSAMEGNSDFAFYLKQKELKKYGEVEAMMGGVLDPRRPEDLAAWTLDKYKQVHILEKIWDAFPERDWYMMIDADTYLSWSNLLLWLERLPDPSEKSYLGSPARWAEVAFAHGGSGILMSRATVYDFAVTHNGSAASWDKPMHEECCGDYVIGMILKERGIILKESWPTINGENPVTLPFGSTHWCEPSVTMHHVQPNHMSIIANFERSRANQTSPWTFSDFFNAVVRNNLPDELEDWDSLSTDTMEQAESYNACKQRCEQAKECFQFAFDGKRCGLGKSIHLGQRRDQKDNKKWRSGWNKSKIEQWIAKQPPCHPTFPHT